MTTLPLIPMALGMLALATLLAAALLWCGQSHRARNGRTIQNALQQTSPRARLSAGDAPVDPAAARNERLRSQWLDNRAARVLVAAEDRHLIQQSGVSPVCAEIALLLSRVLLAVGLPLIACLTVVDVSRNSPENYLAPSFALVLGFMLPKWVLQATASRGRRRVGRELPLFVDLLGLLQGVGLSLDQSLQVVANEFQGVLPVLSHEVARANRQYTQGRSREHAFQRIASLHGNQHLSDFVALILQVDKHGGAIQEPIRQFSERLRVHRKADMKKRVGTITVKMTVVMVTTLLPALMVITAGPGLLAVMRSLGSMIR